MGVTTSTPANMVLGPGRLSINGDPQGAEKDNATFKLVRRASKPDQNHRAAPLAGAVYVFEEIPSLTVTLSEFELNQLLAVMPMAEVTGDGETEAEVLRSRIGRLPEDAFTEVEYEIVPGDGRPLTVRIFNATVDLDDDFEATFGNEEDGSYEVTFVGHADPADPELSPYEIERALASE